MENQNMSSEENKKRKKLKNKIGVFLKNHKKKAFYGFILAAVVFGAFYFSAPPGEIKDGKLVMGVITDIHAGNKKHRNYGNGNELNPRDFCINLNKVFAESKADFFVVTGDVVLDGGNVEAEMVLDCIKKSEAAGRDFIWAMGNHDDERTWKGLGMSGKYYHSVDRGDWRIIVLYDSVYNARTEGGLDEEQLAWLDKELDTDKKVIIAQHHPLWGQKYVSDPSKVSSGENFDKEAEILSRHDNVKYVLSGHAHKDHFCLKKDSYTFCRVRALGLLGYEGSYMEFELQND